MRLNPLTLKKLRRFRSIRRGWWSFVVLSVCFLLSLVAELWINSRALVVNYNGKLYFPTYTAFHSGKDFGLAKDPSGIPYEHEVNYRELQGHFQNEGKGDWVWMPLVPYSPLENDFAGGNVAKPMKPDWSRKHYLGTDSTGRDILARLVYGFRIAMVFALGYVVMVYAIGIVIGCAMGYFGGNVDLLGQRLVEIWANIPFLYMVIIMVAIIPPGLSQEFRIALLLLIMVLFSWTGMTYYMRSSVYKEKARDYIAAAQLLGAGPVRILFTHMLPNTISTLVTFAPFTIAAAIASLSALDYLGFGLPPPVPSLGELLKQGIAQLQAPWIVTSAFLAMVFILTLVTFIGEAVREAFDPKKFTTYE
jgi:microcin C transport system permease protein